MKMSRRALLATLGIMAASPLLTACETVKDGDTTTHILNVSKITAYATAGLNAATTVATALSLNPAFLSASLKVQEYATIIRNDLEVFTQAVGDELSISYNDYNWKTLVDTLILDLDRLLNVIATVVIVMFDEIYGPSNSTSVKIKLIYDALSTIVSVFKALVGSFIATASGPATMTEEKALAILK